MLKIGGDEDKRWLRHRGILYFTCMVKLDLLCNVNGRACLWTIERCALRVGHCVVAQVKCRGMNLDVMDTLRYICLPSPVLNHMKTNFTGVQGQSNYSLL